MNQSVKTKAEKSRYRHIAPVASREELIYLLSRAAELEHGLACVYLFAAHSLKSEPAEGGLNDEQAATVASWKRKIVGVAVEEMLHLAQVTNLLTAVGGAPHFRRSNFPLPADAFSFGLELSLEPFSKELIERLVCYEMPERGILDPQRQQFYDAMLARVASLPPVAAGKRARPGIEPFEVDFKTVGEFYHKIETGFRTLNEKQLFIGPPLAQAKAQYLDLGGELVEVIDRASACAAIDMIVAQGESPTAEHPDAHFCVFDSIRAQYEALVAEAKEKGTEFSPVRPLISNPMTRLYPDTTGGNVISDPITHDVADLYNVSYDTMLLMLVRFFAHDGENEEELRLLARGTLRLMASVLRPLGEALTKRPVGPPFEGWTAGPGFGYNRDLHLLPHKNSAWAFFIERLWELSTRTVRLAQQGVSSPELTEAAAALESVIAHLTPLAPEPVVLAKPVMPSPSHNESPTINCEVDGPYLVTNLQTLTNSKGEKLGTRATLALCRCGGSSLKPYCDGTHARIGFHSAKQSDRTPDRLDRYDAKDLVVLDNRGTCCHSGNCTDHLPSVFRQNEEPFVNPNGASKEEIISIVRACPSGALGYIDSGAPYDGEDRGPAIYVSSDGPYHVYGAIALANEQRNQGANLEHYALCRCGHSKNKPFCDGSHWYAKFHDEDN